MKLNRIKAKNFNSYNELHFDFKDGVWLVTGKNGSGKSSLFDMIAFSLFGKTRSDIDSIIKIGKPYTKVIIVFEINGSEYKIMRKRIRNENSELKFIGEKISLQNPTIIETQKEIEKIIGFNYESFATSAYFGQGRLANFMEKTPKERKELFFEILGLGIYQIAETKTKEKIKEIELNTITNETNINNNEEAIEEYKDELDGLEYDEKKYNIKVDKEYILDKKIKDLNNLLLKKMATAEKINIIIRMAEEKEENDTDLMELKENIKSLNLEIKKIIIKIDKIDVKKIKEKIITLDNTNKICPTCGAKIESQKNINKMELLGEKMSMGAVLITKKAGIEMKIKEIKKSIVALNRRNETITEQIGSDKIENKKEILNGIEIIKNEIDKLEEKKEELDEELRELERAEIIIESKIEKIKSLQDKILLLKKESKRDREILNEYKILQRAFSRDGIPSHILENILPELEIETNKFLSDIMDEPFNIKYIVQGATKSGKIKNTFDIEITENQIKRSFNSFSGGEKVRVNIAIRLSISKLLSGIAGTDLEFLLIDEIEYLDSDGLDKFAELIQKLQRSFKTIILISHIKELQNKFQNIIYIEKENGESRIIKGDL